MFLCNDNFHYDFILLTTITSRNLNVVGHIFKNELCYKDDNIVKNQISKLVSRDEYININIKYLLLK